MFLCRGADVCLSLVKSDRYRNWPLAGTSILFALNNEECFVDDRRTGLQRLDNDVRVGAFCLGELTRHSVPEYTNNFSPTL